MDFERRPVTPHVYLAQPIISYCAISLNLDNIKIFGTKSG